MPISSLKSDKKKSSSTVKLTISERFPTIGSTDVEISVQ
jgi:hypothetical protein